MDTYAPHSWPRIVEETSALIPAVRRPGPYDAWPRWGWFPRENRTWTLAPSPALTVRPPSSLPPFAPFEGAFGEPPSEVSAAADAPIEARPIGPQFTEGRVPPPRAAVPASTPSSATSTGSSLVPVRRELVLADVERAARRVAPVVAIAGVVAVAALALFRRR